MRWWHRFRMRRSLRKMLRHTATDPDGQPFIRDGDCSCPSRWAKLETTANGFVLPAVASEQYSILTNPDLSPLAARCSVCHARYDRPWLIPKGTPMPFAWARDPRA
jgi:hypothetical protein